MVEKIINFSLKGKFTKESTEFKNKPNVAPVTQKKNGKKNLRIVEDRIRILYLYSELLKEEQKGEYLFPN